MNIRNIVLDLDETLISAIALEDFQANKYYKKAQKFRSHVMEDCYIIFERPFLQLFLDYIFKNYNVSVWTAASKEYGEFVIKNVIIGKHKNRQIDFFFHHDHCKMSKKITSGKPKAVCLLWNRFQLPGYNKNNTVLLDDNPSNFKGQLKNVIQAPAFQFESKNALKDDFLLQLLLNKDVQL